MLTGVPDFPRLQDGPVSVLARAARGDPGAIGRLASSPEGIRAAVRHRLAPLVSHFAHREGLEIPSPWSESTRRIGVLRMLLEESLAEVGAALGNAGIPWLPLKGLGPVARLYPQPECRPTTDLDILVPRDSFTEARKLLERNGWEGLHTGEEYEAFLLREGYNWQAAGRTGVLLELHFGLWGPVDPALAATLLDRASPAQGPGTTARESGPVESFLVCASHLWNSPRPVALLYFLDLELLAHAAPDPGFAADVVSLARRHDLQLLVGLAAAIAHRLWPNEVNAAIAANLLDDLRRPERILVAATRRRSPLNFPLEALVLARLLAGRTSRSGWRAPLRRLWPHPAVFRRDPGRGPLAALRKAVTRPR